MQLSRQYALIKIFNPSEIIGFVSIIFIFMYIAFPKGLFNKLILAKNDINIDLTIKYLEALSKSHSNSDIKIAILKKYLSLGRIDEAESLLDKLKLYGATYNKYIKDALWIEYNIWKREYFATEDLLLKKRYLKLMKSNLDEYIYLTKNEQELEQAYNEAKSMNLPYLAKKISFRLAQITNSNKWLKIAFFDAVNIRDFKNARVLARMVEAKSNDEDTLNILYHFYYYDKNYKKSFLIAKKLMNYFNKSKDKSKYISYLLESAILSNNKKFIRLYSNELINMINDPKTQKSIIKKLINLSIYNKDIDLAKNLISTYFPLFRNNIDDNIFIIKSAMSLNAPKFASLIADRIAKLRGLIR